MVDANGMLSQVLAEFDDTGGLITWYTRGDELISLSRSDETRFYLYDGHGSTRLLTDEDGAVTDTYTFDAYGNLTARTGATVNDFLYCGEQFDQTTGLYYLRARYMNPQAGTFISMDVYQGSIFDPVSLHKYLYANANPVMNVDPTGYFTLSELIHSQTIQNMLDMLHNSQTRLAISILNAIATVYDTGAQIFDAVRNGKPVGEIILTAAQSMIFGLFTGILLNNICQLSTTIRMVVSVTSIAVGLTSQLDGIIDALKEGRYDLFAARLIKLVANIYALTDSCFTGDTLVATEDGYKRIDEIEIGDLVWAYNVETGELEPKEVLIVYVKENKEILHLETSIGNINTTTNHPFYVIGEGWVAAWDLVVGDEVYALDGSVSIITGYWLEVFDTPVTVYNLKVEGFHTYFVGEFGVLVHNDCEQTGSYDVEFESGKHYVGKGSESRMRQSALRVAGEHNDTVKSMTWSSSMGEIVAFIDEFMRMALYDFDFEGILYNKIMSPGAKYFEEGL